MNTPRSDLPDLLPGFAERLEARAEEVASAHRSEAARAASESVASTRSRRRWRLFGGGTLVAVVAVSGAYASGLWRPQLGSNPADPPAASARPVAPELLDRVAVLRRPQTDADRSAAAEAALRFPATSRSGIQTAAVRTVRLEGGTVAVLVPVRDQATGAQELCLAVLAAQQPGTRVCATAAEVTAGRLLAATEAPIPVAQEDDRAARRREAQGADADASGSVQQDRSTTSPTRIVGVAPDGIRAVWIGDAGPVRPEANVFDLTDSGVSDDLRARWDR